MSTDTVRFQVFPVGRADKRQPGEADSAVAFGGRAPRVVTMPSAQTAAFLRGLFSALLSGDADKYAWDEAREAPYAEPAAIAALSDATVVPEGSTSAVHTVTYTYSRMMARAQVTRAAPSS